MVNSQSYQTAAALFEMARKNGGITLPLDARGPEIPRRGYVVGGKYLSLILSLGARTDEAQRQEIRRWLDHLPAARAIRYVGSWLDGSNIVVDACDVVPDLETAIKLARARGERAIYSLWSNSVQYVR